MAGSGCSPETGEDAELLVNGHLDETQLHRKLSLLSPVPGNRLPLYLRTADLSPNTLPYGQRAVASTVSRTLRIDRLLC